MGKSGSLDSRALGHATSLDNAKADFRDRSTSLGSNSSPRLAPAAYGEAELQSITDEGSQAQAKHVQSGKSADLPSANGIRCSIHLLGRFDVW